MFRFVFGIHCHQPVGNFDDVIDRAVEDAYRPMLAELEKHSGLRMVVHVSGCLLQVLEKRNPQLVETLARLARSGQIELLGGGYYEPIFPVIPAVDLRGQIEHMSRAIEKLSGRRPRGAWLPERVWESWLPAPLAEAGVEYLPVDDEHFRAAGLRSKSLTNRFIVEAAGRSVALFPIDEKLRYMIPFHPVSEVIDELKRRADENPDGVVVMTDDGEKFGVWPHTKESCWDKKWVPNFLEALAKESDWLRTTTFEEVVDSTEPAGAASIPASSYFEMGEWSLPVEASRDFAQLVRKLKKDKVWEDVRPFIRGGTWRGFGSKYPETRHRLARVRDLSERVRPFDPTDPGDVPSDREALWRSQCNCAYWHGVFGGIYLPFLRAALSSALLRAEHRSDRASRTMAVGAHIRIADIDADGHPEACLSNGRLSLWFRSDEGGILEEMGDRLRLVDYADVFSRRPEAYHGVNVTAAGGELEGAETATIHDLPVMTEVPPYDPFRRKPLRARLVRVTAPTDLLTAVRDDDPLPIAVARSNFEVEGRDVLRIVSTPSDGNWRLARTVRMRTEGIDVSVRLESETDLPEGSFLVVEWPVALWEKEGEIQIGEELKLAPGASKTASAVRDFVVRNSGNKTSLRFGFARPVKFSHEPIRTISLSEDGPEEIYQGALIAFGVPVSTREATLDFTVDVA